MENSETTYGKIIRTWAKRSTREKILINHDCRQTIITLFEGFVDLLRDDFMEKDRSRGIYFTQDWVSLPGVILYQELADDDRGIPNKDFVVCSRKNNEAENEEKTWTKGDGYTIFDRGRWSGDDISLLSSEEIDRHISTEGDGVETFFSSFFGEDGYAIFDRMRWSFIHCGGDGVSFTVECGVCDFSITQEEKIWKINVRENRFLNCSHYQK
ncbi:hypothetical protein DH2020_002307 [Rehmannia glutinosa]|uniref:Uncharacterized protein n=1 Tax=Rehmannia glutinosa TaxID=99300 RepID=A0ABR0XTY0_REHGL